MSATLKNFSLLAFLVNDSVRCISATYEAADNSPREQFKTLDQTIKPGDFIVVPTGTRHKMTVCKVVEVDLEPDLESSVTMEWVVQKIDRSEFETLIAREEQSIRKARDVEKSHLRREMREKIFQHNSELQNVSLADLRPASSDAAVEDAPAPIRPAPEV